MSVWAVSGAAGYGKTFRLMQRLREELALQPLLPGQAVLALTFMHGARQRLDQRLRLLPRLSGRYECLTVDGFARALRERWRMLGRSLGQPELEQADFNLQCKLAADLLDRKVVLNWVSAGFPIVVLDESQDLDPERLRLVSLLSANATVLLAYDDFQCLDRDMRPSPAARWLPNVCEIEVLQKPQRTTVPALLNATTAIRGGQPPCEGTGFKVVGCVGKHQAAAFMAASLTFPKGARSIAVITPARVGGYAESVVTAVSTKPCGTKKYGPFPTAWESSDALLMDELEQLPLREQSSTSEVIELLASISSSRLARALMRWATKQRDVLGCVRLSRQEVLDAARRLASLQRSRTHRSDRGRRALTVHQAKNREFDGVIVLWPHTVGGDAEAKRRLLYNAVTRAKLWCKVITQGEAALKKAPFA